MGKTLVLCLKLGLGEEKKKEKQILVLTATDIRHIQDNFKSFIAVFLVSGFYWQMDLLEECIAVEMHEPLQSLAPEIC